ncbi:hypothetical protein DENSPDRAFT_869191 [Dentipellis sp. KUC8613]|nr:hypothetical protein DENSPDRAFT_869191 [Dentipellis sp. KUC8613]
MPVAPIDDQGTQLYYEDSGALPGLYTTIVIIHGTAYHGAIFSRMFPHAAAYQLRLVAVNRREYPGSTPLSDEDLRIVNGTDASAGRDFFRRQSVDIVRFLAWFVQNEDIPKIHSTPGERDKAGLILMSWSAGWAHVARVLSDADALPIDLIETLTPYLRGVCANDPPRRVMGLPRTADCNFYEPIFDTSLTDEEYCTYFQPWCSNYYLHPDISTRRSDGLTAEILDNPPEGKLATSNGMSIAEKMAVTSASAVARLERPLLMAPDEFFLDATHGLFKKCDPAAGVWPRCKFYVLWCEQTVWECVMAAWHIEDMYNAKKVEGEVGRELLMLSMPECNHFPHWEKPELTCKVFAEFLG